MSLAKLLLAEFDLETKKTLPALERIPADQADFAPHPKSMPLKRLGPHVAQLPEFGAVVLSMPAFDFASGGMRPLQFESPQQLASTFAAGSARLRELLAALPETAWEEDWKLSHQGHVIFAGSRFVAYRTMFLNHLVHHRAQLGVYLRLLNLPVPSTYGPSADESV